MKINTNKEYDYLIVEHHKEFLDGFNVLDFIEKVENKIFKENPTASLFTAKECMKFNCFLSSSFLDLLTILKGLFNTTTEWEIIFYSKQGYLSIYETVNTYQLYQKSIRDILEQNHPTLVNKFNDLNKLLRNYKKCFNFERDISKYRNRTAAHYDKNIVIYFEQIKKIDKNYSIQTIERFVSFLKLLMQFIYALIEELESETMNECNTKESRTLKGLDDLVQILLKNK